MSPSNRTNPDETDDTGHFGWDVVADCYLVRAFKDGCVGATNRSLSFEPSRTMEIPPPVTDLDLRLFCGEGDDDDGGGTPPLQGGGTGRTTTGGNTPPLGGGTSTTVTLGSLKAVKLLRGRLLRVRVTCSRLAVGRCSGAWWRSSSARPSRRSGSPACGRGAATTWRSSTRKGWRIVRRSTSAPSSPYAS